jgi:hypothetical protein
LKCQDCQKREKAYNGITCYNEAKCNRDYYTDRGTGKCAKCNLPSIQSDDGFSCTRYDKLFFTGHEIEKGSGGSYYGHINLKGERSSLGVMIYEQGQFKGGSYSGEWKGNIWHGKAKLDIPSELFRGYFKDGIKQGWGESKYKDGTYYRGTHKDGMMHG